MRARDAERLAEEARQAELARKEAEERIAKINEYKKKRQEQIARELADMDSLKEDDMMTMFQEFMETCEAEKRELEKGIEREKQKLRDIIASYHWKFLKPIPIRCGKQTFAASLTTLTKTYPESLFAQFFLPPYPLMDDKGVHVFPREVCNGKMMGWILDFLRDGEWGCMMKHEEYTAMCRACDLFRLPPPPENMAYPPTDFIERACTYDTICVSVHDPVLLPDDFKTHHKYGYSVLSEVQQRGGAAVATVADYGQRGYGIVSQTSRIVGIRCLGADNLGGEPIDGPSEETPGVLEDRPPFPLVMMSKRILPFPYLAFISHVQFMVSTAPPPPLPKGSAPPAASSWLELLGDVG